MIYFAANCFPESIGHSRLRSSMFEVRERSNIISVSDMIFEQPLINTRLPLDNAPERPLPRVEITLAIIGGTLGSHFMKNMLFGD